MKRFVLCMAVSTVVSLSGAALANQGVSIVSVNNQILDGPAHHGLVVKIAKIWDPNLTNFEVQIRPDTGGQLPPWSVYSTSFKPFDGETIVVPYRNGIMALKTDTKYCIKLRAIYASAITPWVESCGLTLNAGNVQAGDADADGIEDSSEYAIGTDPNNKDSDIDGMPDADEVKNGTDPNKALYANVIIETPSLNFGTGNYFGTYPTQHQYILIVNKGDNPAAIEDISVSSKHFKLGAYPKTLSHIPPQNALRLPISFLPELRGNHTATATVKIAYEAEPLPPVNLSGFGDQIPDCTMALSGTLDYGVMNSTSTELARRNIPISNAAEAGDDNEAAPLVFTVLTDNLGIVPGTRGLSVPPGKGIDLPVIIPHLTAGDYSGTLTVKTATCGEHIFEVKAEAK